MQHARSMQHATRSTRCGRMVRIPAVFTIMKHTTQAMPNATHTTYLIHPEPHLHRFGSCWNSTCNQTAEHYSKATHDMQRVAHACCVLHACTLSPIVDVKSSTLSSAVFPNASSLPHAVQCSLKQGNARAAVVQNESQAAGDSERCMPAVPTVRTSRYHDWRNSQRVRHAVQCQYAQQRGSRVLATLAQ